MTCQGLIELSLVKMVIKIDIHQFVNEFDIKAIGKIATEQQRQSMQTNKIEYAPSKRSLPCINSLQYAAAAAKKVRISDLLELGHIIKILCLNACIFHAIQRGLV